MSTRKLNEFTLNWEWNKKSHNLICHRSCMIASLRKKAFVHPYRIYKKVLFFPYPYWKKKQLPFAFAFPLDERLNLNAICEIKYSSASNQLLVPQGNCLMKNRWRSVDARWWCMVGIGRECLHFVPPQSNWQKWHEFVKIMIRKINDDNDIFSSLHRASTKCISDDKFHVIRRPVVHEMQNGELIRSTNRWALSIPTYWLCEFHFWKMQKMSYRVYCIRLVLEWHSNAGDFTSILFWYQRR